MNNTTEMRALDDSEIDLVSGAFSLAINVSPKIAVGVQNINAINLAILGTANQIVGGFQGVKA